MYVRSFPKSIVSIAAGALFGLSLGCVISTNGGGSDECGSLLSHSHEGADGMCYCDSNYTWENPEDDNDYDCERIDGKGGGSQCDQPNSDLNGDVCYCDPGYIWCDLSDPNDYSCCLDPAQDSNAGTGDASADTGNDTGTDTAADTTASTGSVDDTGPDPGVEPNPADCTTEAEGVRFCSHTSVMGPEGSTLWNCMGGEWVEVSQADLDAECVFDNYEFAYGCTDDAETETVGPVCGFGPGTDCSGDDATCADDDLLEYCFYGKLSSASCLEVCQDASQKVTYDHGYCAEDGEAPGVFDCFCCDEGDEGCPINEVGTSSGG
ncbi:MAG: hypothetical protein IAG13_08820 [Deltaproteobacteria bacterium]|nr:hypothetical protein [Nannocystaceae bacterium]